jgi:malate dehydrogenase (oxaloacetate-decarboxylating)(NADP+)
MPKTKKPSRTTVTSRTRRPAGRGQAATPTRAARGVASVGKRRAGASAGKGSTARRTVSARAPTRAGATKPRRAPQAAVRALKATRAASPRPRVPKGLALLQNPLLNKGTAFTEAERDALGLRGLLPPHVDSMEEKVERVLRNYHKKPDDLERYIYLTSLQDRNETLFYRVVMDHIEEMMPVIYTPVVGQACEQYGHIFQRPRGMYVSYADRGRIGTLLRNWPHPDVRIVVVTDGERILGLGDLGAFGMGIPVGKLSLYTACAGIDPAQCLPVLLDVGTERESLLEDPLYTGIRQRRVRGEPYLAFVDEFLQALTRRFPKALVQFEDFANTTAFGLLETYRDRICTFNDDIQGTAGVTLAGLYSALRITGQGLRDQRILFLGAGEAGVGIGDLIVSALVDEGLPLEEARRRCWFVDSQGLVVRSREGLAEHKLRFAHEHGQQPDLLSAIEELRPTALIGVSTVAGAFNREVVEAMARLNERPIVFALSNPTFKAECSAQDAYAWSQGRAIYASGSPFPPCEYGGRTYVPGQGNNAYIFPGVGLGASAVEARHVTDRMFFEAAKALAGQVLESDLEIGRIYPSLSRIQEVSAAIAAAVAESAYRDRLARVRRPRDILAFIKRRMWKPEYRSYA